MKTTYSDDEKDKIIVNLRERIHFKVWTLFSTQSKDYESKLNILFAEVFPDFEALSWISSNDFAEIADESLTIMHKNYTEIWEYWFENDQENLVKNHERVGELIINKYNEYQKAQVKSMIELINQIAIDHDKTVTESNDKRGGCFVATAVMGNHDDLKVIELREFRDTWLKKRSWGRAFVDWYYKNGPLAARFINKHEFIKEICYFTLILPAIYLTKILTKFSSKTNN